MNEERHPLQAQAAQLIVDRSKRALERALPRGVDYVVILSAPGFRTIGANISKADQLELVQGLTAQLSSDIFQGLT